MGNYCRECNLKEVDEGNLCEKIQINTSNTKKSNKLSNLETNMNPDLDLAQNISNNVTDNFIDQQIFNMKIPENIINTTRKLKLIVLQSKYLTEGNEYLINAGGLIGSKRGADDGVTYFGDISVSNIFIIGFNEFFSFILCRIIIKMISNSLKKNLKMGKV